MKIAEIEELYDAYNEYATAEPHPISCDPWGMLLGKDRDKSVTISQHSYEVLKPYFDGTYVTEFSIPGGIKLRTEGIVSRPGGVLLLNDDKAELPYDISTIVRLRDVVEGIVAVGKRIKLQDILGKGGKG